MDDEPPRGSRSIQSVRFSDYILVIDYDDDNQVHGRMRAVQLEFPLSDNNAISDLVSPKSRALNRLCSFDRRRRGRHSDDLHNDNISLSVERRIFSSPQVVLVESVFFKTSRGGVQDSVHIVRRPHMWPIGSVSASLSATPLSCIAVLPEP